MALTAYEQQTQRLLHDPNAQAYALGDVDRYINIARNQIAIEGECCRALLSGGMITALTIANGGTGYTNPISVTIAAGGSQATATATQALGVINSVTLTSGGWGYLTAPTVTVIGATGTGAAVTAIVDNSATTVTGIEVIPFSALNTVLATWNSNAVSGSPNPIVGLRQVIKVFDVACSQSGTFKPMLTPVIWSEYQAYLRIYQNTQQNYPVYWSQYGQGVAGNIYLFPIPAQPLQMDVDVCATVVDLTSDSTPEAIPYPWTDAVPYYAAYLAYENSSRKEDADRMFKMYTMFMKRGRAFSETPFTPNYYPPDM